MERTVPDRSVRLYVCVGVNEWALTIDKLFHIDV